MTSAQRVLRRLLYLLFAISGFSGLIYESIWSHYLKLFLGHAAYAQTLVLAIFMGGMAIGAWLPTRYGARWKNLLAVYALVEGVVGIGAVVFHSLFVNTTDFAFDTVIPALGSPWAIQSFKWGLGALLILPQSILLGMTFPLMSAGLIRRCPSNSGESLAMLYFTNSIGAAIGVLVSGFILIEQIGLPATMLAAGVINILLALLVGWLSYRRPEPKIPAETGARRTGNQSGLWRLLIVASLVTGAASFIYEIAWIRMLSLVLGASTHAFELMLSAFILGLAFGGLWIRRRIDLLKHPIQFLGWVQVIMGLLALGTLIVYDASFSAMQILMHALARTESGYFLFNPASHAITIIVMVPVTFCAGMTLPLITHALWRSGYGEKSIGTVYAANTVGAIVGIFFAVHIGLPLLGLKGLLTAGAALDMGLGVALLGGLVAGGNRRPGYIAAGVALAATVAVLLGVDLDHHRMASGVYRAGFIHTPKSAELLFHRDGKTATVDLLKHPNVGISIRTNGKSDGMINMDDGGRPSPDEATMILTGAIPLALHPRAQTAANIGMGTGLTTQILLASEHLRRIDTIEIEPTMIEAAQVFRPRVEAAFTDPRSVFHIDDAKTFFSSHQARYDLITSEPSNPWVSGVAGLFSHEFYRRTREHLNPGGLFVQWLQIYEMDPDLVASVLKAIGNNFSDYALYACDDGDLLIVSVREGNVPSIHPDALQQQRLAQELRRVGILSVDDLKLRYIGDRAIFEPLFAAAPLPANSDFFPVLDTKSVRSRFLEKNARALLELRSIKLPALEMLGKELPPRKTPRSTPAPDLLRSRLAHDATLIRDFYTSGRTPTDLSDPELLSSLLLTGRLDRDCKSAAAASLWFDSAITVMDNALPHLSSSEAYALWMELSNSVCLARLTGIQRDTFTLYGAIARRDAANMARVADLLLNAMAAPGHGTGPAPTAGTAGNPNGSKKAQDVLAAGMLGYLASDKPQEAQRLWTAHASRALGTNPPGMLLRLLRAHSTYQNPRATEKAIARN